MPYPPPVPKAPGEPGRGDGLTPQQVIFVAEYMKHANATKAAETAGYAEPDVQGWDLIRRNVRVRWEIEQRRKALAETTEYGAREAMEEAKEAMAFSMRTDNANAYVKAVELRSKIMGLLVEKGTASMVGFSIQINGISQPEVVTVQNQTQIQDKVQAALPPGKLPDFTLPPLETSLEELDAEFKSIDDKTPIPPEIDKKVSAKRATKRRSGKTAKAVYEDMLGEEPVGNCKDMPVDNYEDLL